MTSAAAAGTRIRLYVAKGRTLVSHLIHHLFFFVSLSFFIFIMLYFSLPRSPPREETRGDGAGEGGRKESVPFSCMDRSLCCVGGAPATPAATATASLPAPCKSCIGCGMRVTGSRARGALPRADATCTTEIGQRTGSTSLVPSVMLDEGKLRVFTTPVTEFNFRHCFYHH